MLNMIAYYLCGSCEFKGDTPFIKDNMVPWCVIEKLVMLFGWKGLEQSDSKHTSFSPVLNKRFEGLSLNPNELLWALPTDTIGTTQLFCQGNNMKPAVGDHGFQAARDGGPGSR